MRRLLRRASLATAIAASWSPGSSPARADEPGAQRIPSGGEDVVRLDDGRTLRGRVAGKEATGLRLELPAGPVLVSKERVARVLLFRDFDPAPRDAAEKEKAGRGLVRWSGDWVSPVRAKELRAAFLAAEAKAVAESRPAPGWAMRNVVRAPPFVVESDLPLARVREYGDLLQKYLECLRSHLQLSIGAATAGRAIPVHVHRDYEGFQEEAARDGGVGEHTVGYFQFGGSGGNEHLVLFDLPTDRDLTLDVLLHEATHMFFHFAAGSSAQSADQWLHEGLAEYMGGSTWRYGKFQPGALQEERLLCVQEMLEEGRVIPLDRLLRPSPGDREGFGLDHYAESWCFVHFLLHGRQGAYRGAFRDLLKEGKFATAADYLLYRFERKDFQKVQKEFEEYARGLRLTGGRAYASRALRRANDGETARAEADLARAVERAGRDGPTLVLAARAAHALERTEEAAGLYLRAIEQDPLDASLRLERARCGAGAEALLEARFAAALAPEDGKVLGEAARTLYGLAARGDASLPPAKDLSREAGDLAARAAAAGGASGDVALAARAALEGGDLGRAREILRRARGGATAETVGLRAAIEGIDGKPEAMAALLSGFRQAVRGTAAGPRARAADQAFAEALSIAVSTCLKQEKGKEAAAALDLLYAKDAPCTDVEWGLWASAAGMASGPGRAAEILEEGLRAFPRSLGLLRMRKTLGDGGAGDEGEPGGGDEEE